MSGIGVVTNPRSRANLRRPERMRQLAYLLGSKGSAAATRSIDDLYRVAEEFKAADIDILGIHGGDGTIHYTLTAFIKTYAGAPLPKIAILRGGTMNTISNGLGIRGRRATPQQLLYNIIEDYHAGVRFQTTRRPIQRIGSRYGFIIGNGVIYNFLEAYYKTGRASPSTAVRLVARLAASSLVGGSLSRRMLERFRARVTVNGREWAREDFVTVTASSVPQIGLGFTPFYRCDEKPGHFAVLGIHTSPISLVFELPRIFRGRPIRRDKCISEVATEVVFESERPIGYTIDGDTYLGETQVHVATGPELEIILPADERRAHREGELLLEEPAEPAS
jgi:diacylglycerol kinase family enzyme